MGNAAPAPYFKRLYRMRAVSPFLHSVETVRCFRPKRKCSMVVAGNDGFFVDELLQRVVGIVVAILGCVMREDEVASLGLIVAREARFH